ncbi:MAG: hypothetical protein ACFE8L_00265 [Candidatus Hodarchaeota archaeon]
MKRSFLNTKMCPICKKKLFYNHNGRTICRICKIECIFDPDTGSIRFIDFYGNRD